MPLLKVWATTKTAKGIEGRAKAGKGVEDSKREGKGPGLGTH
jgi:hypothetical protein